MFGAYGFGQTSFAALGGGPNIFAVAITEAINTADTITASLATNTAQVETINTTDAAIGLLQVYGSALEALNINSTETVMATFLLASTETLSILDFSNAADLQEQYNLNDSIQVTTAYNVLQQESINVQDVVDVSVDYNVVGTESYNTADSIEVIKIFNKEVEETLNVADSTAGLPNYSCTAQESLVITTEPETTGWYVIDSTQPSTWVVIDNAQI
jgi:hypothetical protein